MKKHFYLYQITNKVNGKIYIGVHQTTNLNDGYMGSGKIIRRAIQKTGIENFTKEIIETFESADDMFARESQIVTEEFLSRDDVYNLRRGGTGGFDHINKSNLNGTAAGRKLGGMNRAIRESLDRVIQENNRIRNSLTMKRTHKEGKLRYDNFSGKRHTDETKRRISEKLQFISNGERNSQSGTMWITNDQSNKKIKKTDPIPEGWRKGRILKQRGNSPIGRGI